MSHTGLSPDELRRLLSWERAYWQHLATRPAPRFWTRAGWSWLPWLSDDERTRRTLVWGRWVVALWFCRCEDCALNRANLQARIDREDPL